MSDINPSTAPQPLYALLSPYGRLAKVYPCSVGYRVVWSDGEEVVENLLGYCAAFHLTMSAPLPLKKL